MEKFKSVKGPLFRILYTNDKIFIDKTGSYYSLEKWNEDFNTMTGWHNEKWAPFGYIQDELLRVRPGPNTKSVDFKQLWDCLNSQDEAKL